MSAFIKCDGCGKKEPMIFYPNGSPGWYKPEHWFRRQDEDGPQDACSRACVAKIAAKSKKTDVVSPL